MLGFWGSFEKNTGREFSRKYCEIFHDFFDLRVWWRKAERKGGTRYAVRISRLAHGLHIVIGNYCSNFEIQNGRANPHDENVKGIN